MSKSLFGSLKDAVNSTLSIAGTSVSICAESVGLVDDSLGHIESGIEELRKELQEFTWDELTEPQEGEEEPKFTMAEIRAMMAKKEPEAV